MEFLGKKYLLARFCIQLNKNIVFNILHLSFVFDFFYTII